MSPPLLILAPMKGELEPALRPWGAGRSLAVPFPGDVSEFTVGGQVVRAGWSGIGRAATEGALDALLALPTEAVLHVGVAGGLRDGQSAGDAYLCERAFGPGEPLEWTTPSDLAAALRLDTGGCLTVEAVVGDPNAKQALADQCPGAHVVEMETYWAARFVLSRGVPFAAVRVVCDTIDAPLPDLGQAIDRVGRPRPLAFVKHLAKNPRTLGQLPAMASAFKRAQSRLCEVVRRALS